MPGRLLSAEASSARSGYAARRPETRVSSLWPAPGCTTTPGGLLITRSCASSQTTSNGTLEFGSGGRSTLSVTSARSALIDSPVCTFRCRVVCTRPSTATPPAAINSATSRRVRPVSSARLRSSRSPANDAGTSKNSPTRCTLNLPPRRSHAAVSPVRNSQKDGSSNNGRIGDVERRPDLQRDEVDDCSAMVSEEAIGEVATGAAEHETERGTCGDARHSSHDPEDEQQDDQHDEDDWDRKPASDRECHAGVVLKAERKRTQHVDWSASQVIERDRLRHLIDDEDYGRTAKRQEGPKST